MFDSLLQPFFPAVLTWFYVHMAGLRWAHRQALSARTQAQAARTQAQSARTRSDWSDRPERREAQVKAEKKQCVYSGSFHFAIFKVWNERKHP